MFFLQDGCSCNSLRSSGGMDIIQKMICVGLSPLTDWDDPASKRLTSSQKDITSPIDPFGTFR